MYQIPQFKLVIFYPNTCTHTHTAKVGVTSTLSIAFGNGNEEIPANLGNPIDLRYTTHYAIESMPFVNYLQKEGKACNDVSFAYNIQM